VYKYCTVWMGKVVLERTICVMFNQGSTVQYEYNTVLYSTGSCISSTEHALTSQEKGEGAAMLASFARMPELANIPVATASYRHHNILIPFSSSVFIN